ncbi:MAG: alpha/beta hydrolase [Gammaproteobacteria bacterium]|jgi:pimeloyl-ACP methyl ester carboxylesterase|nr:alpha/beta hydrolase [Gammaproteobacteria bacterium]
MRFRTSLAAALGLAVAGLTAFTFMARSGRFTPDETELLQRYALPASQFIDIDGQRVHYADTGTGAPVVLIHGSYGSLLDWEQWAAALTPKYRVVRFDLPRMGLSGPTPDGVDSVEYRVQLLRTMARQLRLERFLLVATSSGGEFAAAYAAQYPETLSGLILANIAVGALNMDMSHLSLRQQAVLAVNSVFAGWRMQNFWQVIMSLNYARPERVEPQRVARWTDLNNRAQRMPPVVRVASAPRPFVRTPDDLTHITVPTLLLWSAEDAEVPVETMGRKALDLLASTDKQLLTVPDCGHMMLLECGAESAAMAQPFIARVTR